MDKILSEFDDIPLAIPGMDKTQIEEMVNSEAFVHYMHDQTYQWTLVNYIVNALSNGSLSEEKLADYLDEGRTFE